MIIYIYHAHTSAYKLNVYIIYNIANYTHPKPVTIIVNCNYNIIIEGLRQKNL